MDARCRIRGLSQLISLDPTPPLPALDPDASPTPPPARTEACKSRGRGERQAMMADYVN